MASKVALSGDSGASVFVSFLGEPCLSAVEVEVNYSDAVFDCSSSWSVIRAALSTAECSWPTCGISAGIVQHPLLTLILVSLQTYFFFWTYSRSVSLNLHLRTDAVHLRNLAHLFSSTCFTIAFGRVIIHFSVAKLVCSRVRLRSLGQWRSFTNLPLSSLWF